MPIKVVKKIISLQLKFFWVGGKEKKGIPLIKWEIIQLPKNMGGIGVSDLVIKNVALLFK